jgi:hypothetical protein
MTSSAGGKVNLSGDLGDAADALRAGRSAARSFGDQNGVGVASHVPKTEASATKTT